MKVKLAIITSFLCFVLLVGFVLVNHRSPISNDNSRKIVQSHIWSDLNEEELYGYADIIAIGEVKSINSPQKTWLDDQLVIYTDYIFIVNEAFKGSNPGDEITIRVPGGKIDNIEFTTDAVKPEMKKQQILFLKKYELGDQQDFPYAILCGPLGKYTLNIDQAENDIKKTENISSLKERLYLLKNTIGDKIVLPNGFIK